ncbi:hypothetical protein KI387_037544 [Taxus chinensis]|uniref:Fe2OG dioxygenase domain-containing protein n=1 Tax=Taxus chinensis TaxID=29808 RepID=A0AA38KS98_TAXCH|nr:hypothetical protein KI387_037544 [Taxus chinensis]
MAEIDLPLIDVSQFPQELEFEGAHFHNHPEVAKLEEACKEWGFFRVVNHGIEPDLLQKVMSVSRDLLSMPAEVKERVQTYNAVQTYNRSESFYFLDMPNPDLIQQISRKIWPEDGNSNFCETIDKYSLFLSDLQTKITKSILASLGLDPRTFYQCDFEKCKATLFINKYSCDEKCRIGDEALASHADPGCLTILYNDEREGLEIRSKQGKWFNVRPAPDSFIVNLGDSMKAWSNGRYRSADHRVVYRGWMNRISLPFFITPPLDAPDLGSPGARGRE